jgi:hypothetical protein
VDLVRLKEEFPVRLGSEHVGRDLCHRFASKRPQSNELRSRINEVSLRLLHLMETLARSKRQAHATGSEESREGGSRTASERLVPPQCSHQDR